MSEIVIPSVSGRGGARPGAGRKPNAEKTDAYLLFVKAKAQKEVFAAKKAELELKQFAGELVRVNEVTQVIDHAVRLCKQHLLTIPGRCAGRFAAESDTRKIEHEMESEIRAALEYIAKTATQFDHEYGS